MGIVGIDIGGTSFRIGLVDDGGEVTDFRKVPVKQVFATRDPLKDLGAYLKDYIQDKDAAAVSIGFPATLDAERQRVLQAPNVAFLENLPVVEVLTRELGIPVCIERDVNFGLLYDCRKYGIPMEGIVCGFYFGTGIGNAIAIDGKLLIGRNGTAGELGHIPVDGSREICGCGNTGCLEPLAGGRYLVHLCETVYRDCEIGQLFVAHGGEPLLRQFVDRMAMGVATEVNILNPHWILIGGGVPAMAAFPKQELLERIHWYARKPYPAKDMPILFTGDEEIKCVVGAAMYGRTKF